MTLSATGPEMYEGDVVGVQVSFNDGASFELARTAAGSTQFRILDRYKMTNRLGQDYYRLRLDRTPFYRNDGSTLLSPNEVPNFDQIKKNKHGEVAFFMVQ